MKKITVTATQPIRCNGVDYEPGQTLEVTHGEAQALVVAGAIDASEIAGLQEEAAPAADAKAKEEADAKAKAKAAAAKPGKR